MKNTRLTLNQAIHVFGGTKRKLSAALSISESSMTYWKNEPDGQLSQERSDRIVGAAERMGLSRELANVKRRKHEPVYDIQKIRENSGKGIGDYAA